MTIVKRSTTADIQGILELKSYCAGGAGGERLYRKTITAKVEIVATLSILRKKNPV
ncbi:MAG TPA: hypothetical protein PKA46_15795 [Ferruginibacter sp.]|nr:hypothetical protein [Ferruginibacter sp.]